MLLKLTLLSLIFIKRAYFYFSFSLSCVFRSRRLKIMTKITQRTREKIMHIYFFIKQYDILTNKAIEKIEKKKN